MNKLIPIVLCFLMIMSIPANTNWQELEDISEFESTSGRTGPDVGVVEITHPRESKEADAFSDARNIVDPGEELYFEAWIQNSGNEPITQLGVEVSVFEREVTGQVGTFLNSWNHPDVICPNSFVCAQTELLPGAVLDFGAFVMSVQGSMVTWTPPVGDYYVYVEATTSDANGDSNDADEDNNVQRNRVIVADWTDLSVDLEWTSGKYVEGGDEPVDFTMTVTSQGSIPWDARNVIVHLEANGFMQSAAFWSDENTGTANHHNNPSHHEETANPLSLGQPYNFSEIGTYGEVLIFQNASDPNDNQSDNRWNLPTGVPWVVNGTVTPDSQVESGEYTLTATIIQFTEYGQISPECDSSYSLGNQSTTTTNWCEVNRIKDDNSETQTSTITGYVNDRHDLSLDRLIMNTEGYWIDENGNLMGPATNVGLTAGPVRPGWMTIEAIVMHQGNNPTAYDAIYDEFTQEYDWNVTFTITNRSDNSVEEVHANSCIYGELFDQYQPYATLGGTGALEGRACIHYEMGHGLYDITATANLIGAYSGFDATSFNDAMTIQSVSALENRPVVTATLGNSGTIYAGADDVASIIELSASASDVEDEDTTLKISWDLPGEMFDEDCIDLTDCVISPMLNSDWIGKGRTATVTVEDSFGLKVSDAVTFDVWHNMTAYAETASGVNMSYHIEYADDTPFGVTLTDSTDTFTGKALEGFSGTYDSIAVLDYSPSTLYSAGDLLNSQMTLRYDTTSLEPTSVWFVNPNGNWALIASTDDISVLGSEGTVALPATEEYILANGQIVFMGGTAVMNGIPELHPMTMTLNPQSGGKIGMQWSYMLPAGATATGNEYYHLVVCEGVDDCAAADRVLDTTGAPDTAINQDTYMLTGTSTTHGSMYYATVSICNQDGCHETVAKNSATADKEVDGHPTATNMVVNANAGMTAWDVTWETDGDTSDVKMWRVCYSDSSWTNAGDMPRTCVDAADGETSVSAPMSDVVGEKKFYFTAVPVDALGNYDTAVSLYEVNYTRIDSDNDGYNDLMDEFPEDQTQWFDYDKDGYGDNWGNSSWNTTRNITWPGQFVNEAELADHCPTEFGNSTADGYFGCPDDDGDGIANIYDEYDDRQINNETIDSDGDGVIDSEDLCPGTTDAFAVDSTGCILDFDKDGIQDQFDNCPNTRAGAEINEVGCEIIDDTKEENELSYTEALMAGDPQTVAKTVGVGAVIIAILGFLQTNFIAAMLPDTVKWLQFMRRKSKLSGEEERELSYLQSVVQAYCDNKDTLSEELRRLRSEITARYTNDEIKNSTREKINVLIKDLLEMDSFDVKEIAHDDTYFGLLGTVDVSKRVDILQNDLAMNSVEYVNEENFNLPNESTYTNSAPSDQLLGQVNPTDNYEYLEYPTGSGIWYFRNRETNQWQKYT